MGQKRRFLPTGKVMTLPSAKIPKYPEPKKTWTDAFPGKYPIASSPVSNALIDASIPENKPGLLIKGWIVNGTNLISSIPDQANTTESNSES